MNRHHFAICLSLLCALVGCATGSVAERSMALSNKELERRGSPVRWSATSFDDGVSLFERGLIGKPCATAADEMLQRDVMATIGKAEAQSGAASSPTLIETRCVSINKSQVNEVWVIARGDDEIAYTVALRSQPGGSTDIEVKGPWGNE